MPDLTRRADNPYLQGNPASAFAPEQKRDSLLDQPWMASVAPGLEAGANAVSTDQNRRFQKWLAEADTPPEGHEQQHGGRVENG
jgi:hypothetical protein